MKAFMDKDFLLSTDTAKRLYHEVTEACPIIDYHCHLDPREIYEDIRYENITQAWLGGDHYKWRLMRAAGVPEKYITGDASDHEKFEKYAEVLGKAIGNPLYHWSHLELRAFFGYEGILNRQTAPEVWKLTGEKLQSAGYSARGLITMSNVETICTTDDPIDSLEWHEKLAADKSFPVAVLPAWRPEKAMDIEKPTWAAYIQTLAEVTGVEIRNYEALKRALRIRMDHFAAHGCKLSDHSLPCVTPFAADEAACSDIFAARLAGKTLTAEQATTFKAAFLAFMAGEYRARDWVMQIHYGVRRNNDPVMFCKLGADSGFDCVDDHTSSAQLAAFLGQLSERDALPRTILYSLSERDNAAIDSVIGCFQNCRAVNYIQHGSAWWFNDHFEGMSSHLRTLASQGYLAGFIGMLTDSRSFLSYPRHEYFRRILCRMLGEWVEDGFYPEDMEALKETTRGICYDNAKAYFNF